MNKEVYRIGKLDTKRSKEKWISFINWWMRERQSFDPRPRKLRKFKKVYNRNAKKGARDLYKFQQSRGLHPIFVDKDAVI